MVCFFKIQGCNTEDFNDEDFIEIQVPVTFLGFRNNEIAMSEEVSKKKSKKFIRSYYSKTKIV